MKIATGKRTSGLVASVVLAALAALALISYMRGVESRAFAGAETVEVFVARETIAEGTPAEVAVRQGLIGSTSLPRKAVAEGAIVSLSEIGGKIATVTILKGEQIAGARFAAAGETGSGLAIPTGRQAMAVEVDAPPGVAGFVQTGSRVSIIAHLDVIEGKSTLEPRSQFVLQNIAVLAVGRRIAPVAAGGREEARSEDGPSEKVMLTLAVTAGEAEKLSYAVREGDLYFTLLPPDGAAVKTPGRTRRNEYR